MTFRWETSYTLHEPSPETVLCRGAHYPSELAAAGWLNGNMERLSHLAGLDAVDSHSQICLSRSASDCLCEATAVTSLVADKQSLTKITCHPSGSASSPPCSSQVRSHTSFLRLKVSFFSFRPSEHMGVPNLSLTSPFKYGAEVLSHILSIPRHKSNLNALNRALVLVAFAHNLH